MKIFVDIGNTRLKWRTSEGDNGVFTHRGAVIEQMIAQAWAGLAPPDSVWVACVAGEEVLAALRRYVVAYWSGAAVRVLESQPQCCGVRLAYRQPERFGVDRLAALVAAFGLNVGSPLVVVDAGTAVTVDVLTLKGEHLGGLIMPGKSLLARCLHEGVAANLNDEKDLANDWTGLPNDTAACVHLGLAAMHLGGVLRAVNMGMRVVGQGARVILTGGDAPQLVEHFHDCLHEPDLVLMGLERMAASVVR